MSNLENQDKRTLNIWQIIRKVSRRGLMGTIKYVAQQGLAGVWDRASMYIRLSRAHRINRRFDRK